MSKKLDSAAVLKTKLEKKKANDFNAEMIVPPTAAVGEVVVMPPNAKKEKEEAYKVITDIFTQVAEEFPEFNENDESTNVNYGVTAEAAAAGDIVGHATRKPVPNYLAPTLASSGVLRKDGLLATTASLKSLKTGSKAHGDVKFTSVDSMKAPFDPKKAMFQTQNSAFTRVLGKIPVPIKFGPPPPVEEAEQMPIIAKAIGSVKPSTSNASRNDDFKEIFLRKRSEDDESDFEEPATPFNLTSSAHGSTPLTSDFLQEISCDSRPITAGGYPLLRKDTILDHQISFDSKDLESEVDFPNLHILRASNEMESREAEGPTIAHEAEAALVPESTDNFDDTDLNLNYIEHGTFADEFIQKLQSKSVKFYKPEHPEYSKKASDETSVTNTAQTETSDALNQPIPPFLDSLKLLYRKPCWPHQQLLSKKLLKLSWLRNLMLDDSQLNSLRDLGSSLPNLVTLSVVRCGLISLDGTNGLPNLENLFAADNKITTPSPIAFLSQIRYVDLSGNPIDSLDPFIYLSACECLRCMKLIDTEVSHVVEFHEKMKKFLPTLCDLRPKPTFLSKTKGFLPKVEKVQEFRTPVSEDTIEYFDDLRGKSFGKFMSSATTSSQSPFSATPMHTSGTDASLLIDQEEAESMQLDKKLSKEMTAISEIMELSIVEKRLREVYRPEKWNFRKRGPIRLIPNSIDEMDSLLEDLDKCNGPQGDMTDDAASIATASLSTSTTYTPCSSFKSISSSRKPASNNASLESISEHSEEGESDYVGSTESD